MSTRTWVVAYDIADAKRRRRVAKTLGQIGDRAQKSVFLLHLAREHVEPLRRRIDAMLDRCTDNLRLYPVRAHAPTDRPQMWRIV